MILDLEEFVVGGRLLGMELGRSRSQILEVLGAPRIDTPQRRSYPSMLVYGSLELRLRDDRLVTIALDLSSDQSVEAPDIKLEIAGPLTLSMAEVESLLINRGISWKLDEVMSEADSPVLVTSRDVHLVFDGEDLVRAVASEGRRK